MSTEIEKFVNAGMRAQKAVDKIMARPTLSPGYVRRQLRTMDEMILSIRDAGKAKQIDISETDRDLLADDVEAHARRVIQLSLEIREGAR